MHENDISFAIRGAAFKVHTALGPGLLESAYEAALAYELRQSGYEVRTQMGLPFVYGNIKLDIGYRIDLIVNEKVIVEINP
jgi:GxxExxY protein